MLVCERILAQALPKRSSFPRMLASSRLRLSTVGVSARTFGVAAGLREGFGLQPLRARRHFDIVGVSSALVIFELSHHCFDGGGGNFGLC